MNTKNKSLVFALFAIALMALSSCSRLKPFTQSLYDEYGWTESELKRIQFYLSDNIILRRQASKGNSTIRGGEIKIIEGRKVEEVVIQKGTPGVLIFKPKENRFAISFESGEDKYLVFGPERELNGRYTLRAQEWERRRGKVTYDGKTYWTPSESAYSTLMVDLKRINRIEKRSRTAGGRKIKG